MLLSIQAISGAEIPGLQRDLKQGLCSTYRVQKRLLEVVRREQRLIGSLTN